MRVYTRTGAVRRSLLGDPWKILFAHKRCTTKGLYGMNGVIEKTYANKCDEQYARTKKKKRPGPAYIVYTKHRRYICVHYYRIRSSFFVQTHTNTLGYSINRRRGDRDSSLGENPRLSVHPYTMDIIVVRISFFFHTVKTVTRFHRIYFFFFFEYIFFNPHTHTHKRKCVSAWMITKRSIRTSSYIILLA